MKWIDLSKAVRVQNAFSVFEHALTVGRHWNDQEGVNAAYLDALAEAVRRYDEELPPAPFVVDVSDRTASGKHSEEITAWILEAWGTLSIEARRAAWEQAASDRAARGESPQYCALVPRPDETARCGTCGAWMDFETRKEHVADCPGPPERCAWCDPSFGCFSYPVRCCKRISP